MSKLSKRILALKTQGLSNNQVFQALQKDGIDLDKIVDALNEIGRPNGKLNDAKTIAEEKN
jgi:hypothetical protein